MPARTAATPKLPVAEKHIVRQHSLESRSVTESGHECRLEAPSVLAAVAGQVDEGAALRGVAFVGGALGELVGGREHDGAGERLGERRGGAQGLQRAALAGLVLEPV